MKLSDIVWDEEWDRQHEGAEWAIGFRLARLKDPDGEPYNLWKFSFGYELVKVGERTLLSAVDALTVLCWLEELKLTPRGET